ncbi:MAG: tetratricopeptide repeat protein, partial [Myxococcales bacterium]|nr:tetratricopeptide repeat protein [Myxococcales bacterium]
MADEVDKKRRRSDQTEELEVEELDPFDPPTGEIDLVELEPISQPPPAPGLGRPRKPPTPPKKEKTLNGIATPAASTEHASLAEIEEERTDPAMPPPEAKPEPTTIPPPPAKEAAKQLAKPVAIGESASEEKATKPTAKPRKRKSLPPKRISGPPPARTPAPAPKAPTSKAPATEAKAVAESTKRRPAAPPAPEEVEPTVVKAMPPPIDEALEADIALRDLCEAQLGASTLPPDRAAQLHYELGRLYELRFAEPAKAAQHYQDALRSRPDHVAAIRGARRTLAEIGRHAALPALYDAEISNTREPRDRARLLYTKARLLEEELRQSGPALAVYREGLALDPGNVVILKAIERSLRRDKSWAALEKTYAQLANAVSSPSLRAAWTAIRAHLTETQLKDPVQAAALYEAALEADPHATDALAHVKRLGTTQKRWPQLVEALLTEHSLCEDDASRLAMLVTIAGIEERHMGDAEAAVETLGEALDQAPGEASILRELSRLHRESGRHAEEIDALTLLVEVVGETDEKARICHRIGHLYDQLLSDSASAERWYQRTLRADPGHRAAALALVRLLEQGGRWPEVLSVWEKRVEQGVTAPAERAELHHKIGLLAERELRDPVAAAKHHAKALGLDPEHHAAFDALTRLYAAASRWQELAELYERAIAQAPHDDEAIMWLFRLGAVRQDRLLDAAGAVEAYERILERAPDHRGALHAIVQAGMRAGQHGKVVSALRKEAELTKDPTRTAALLHRAALLTAHEGGDPAAAIRALEALLAKQPKHRASLETLAELLSDAGRWADLVHVYKRLLPLTSTAAEKVRMHYRIGEIHETQIGDDAAAIAGYRAALQLDPAFEPGREALLAALRRTGAWAELTEALEQRIGRLPTPLDRARAATELGTLFEERLNDSDRALSMYERAIDEVPLHHPALDARERLLTQAGKWNALAEALQEEAEAQPDPFLKMQRALRAALVHSDQQGAIAPALEAFRPVFERHPDHIGALLAVEGIYGRTRDDAGLAATYEKMAQVIDDERAALAALHELARTRASSGASTRTVMERILKAAPEDPDALETLAGKARGDGATDREIALQARLAQVASDPRAGAFHQTRVGELLLANDQPTDALAAFRAAIALDPTSLAATR